MTILVQERWIAGLLFFGLLALTARPATDPDLWWHLRTGEWIVSHHQIPHTDPFSFTRAGSPWISQEWLSELLFYEIWRWASWPGLIFFSAIVTTAAFLLLFWRCAAPAHWAAAATVVGALACAPAWGSRPQMFTFLAASLWLWLLERGEKRPWRLLWILPLFLLWLNLHAGFALGPALLVAYAIGMMWEGLSGDTTREIVRLQTGRLGLILAACLALVPLNPSGIELYWYPLRILHSATMRSFITEWRSPDFHRAIYVPLLLLSLTLVAVVALRPRISKARILVPLLATFVAALDAARHVPIFVLLAIPVIAAAAPQPFRIWPSMRTNLAPARFAVIARSLAVLAMAGLMCLQWTRLSQNQHQNEAQMFPVEAIHRLAAANASHRVFAHYDWGGYLIWKLYPDYRVFIDGRADLYGDDLFRQFQDAMELRPGWRRSLDCSQVGAVMVPTSSALAQGLLLDPAWDREYHDAQASLFLRRPGIRGTPEAGAAPKPDSEAGSASLGQKSEKIYTRAALNLRN